MTEVPLPAALEMIVVGLACLLAGHRGPESSWERLQSRQGFVGKASSRLKSLPQKLLPQKLLPQKLLPQKLLPRESLP
ncbi:hypothetical protein GCM10009090_04790 [[Pseudomonas] boreopolis]|uniref:Uncharacterized protein n=1 Tax=Xanthomonas boreopolis TaxID=86183 RepID=A0A919F5L5_9XANT|nr:hypothetical protein GCM10009090_04790 [[Pseudomonas] boreopolis]